MSPVNKWDFFPHFLIKENLGKDRANGGGIGRISMTTLAGFGISMSAGDGERGSLHYTESLSSVERVASLHRQCRVASLTEESFLLPFLEPPDRSVGKQFIGSSLIQHLGNLERRDELWIKIAQSYECPLALRKAAVRKLAKFTDRSDILFKLLHDFYEAGSVVPGRAPRVTYVAKQLWKNGRKAILNGFIKSMWTSSASLSSSFRPSKDLVFLLPFCTYGNLVWEVLDTHLAVVRGNVRFWSRMIKYQPSSTHEQIFDMLFREGIAGHRDFFAQLLATCCRQAPSLCIDILSKMWDIDLQVCIPYCMAEKSPRVVGRALMKCPARKLCEDDRIPFSRLGPQLAAVLVERIDKSSVWLVKSFLSVMDASTLRDWWIKNEEIMIEKYTCMVDIFDLKRPPDIRERTARHILSRADCKKDPRHMFQAFAALPHEEALENFLQHNRDPDASVRIEWHRGLALHYKWYFERKESDGSLFDEYLKFLYDSGNEQCPVRCAMWKGLNEQREDLLVSSEERMRTIYNIFRQALKMKDHSYDLSSEMLDIAMKMFHLGGDLRACEMLKNSLYAKSYDVYCGNKYMKRLLCDPVKLKQLLDMGDILTDHLSSGLPKGLTELELLFPLLDELMKSPDKYPDINRHDILLHLLRYNPKRASLYITEEYVREHKECWESVDFVCYLLKYHPRYLDIYIYELKGRLLTYSPNSIRSLPSRGNFLGSLSHQQQVDYTRLIVEDILRDAVAFVEKLSKISVAERQRTYTTQGTDYLRTQMLVDLEVLLHYGGLPIYNELLRLTNSPALKKLYYIRSVILTTLSRSGDTKLFEDFLSDILKKEAQMRLNSDPLKRQSNPLPLIRAIHSFLPRFIHVPRFVTACRDLVQNYLLSVLPLLTMSHQPPEDQEDDLDEKDSDANSREQEEEEEEEEDHSDSPSEAVAKEKERKKVEKTGAVAEGAVAKKTGADFRLNLYRAMSVLSLSDRLACMREEVFAELFKAYESMDLVERVVSAVLKRAGKICGISLAALEVLKQGLRKEKYEICLKSVKNLPVAEMKEADLADIAEIALGREEEFAEKNDRYGIEDGDERVILALISRIVKFRKEIKMNEGILGKYLYKCLKSVNNPLSCIEGQILRVFSRTDDLLELLISLAADRPNFAYFLLALDLIGNSLRERQLLRGKFGVKLYDSLKEIPFSFILRTYLVLVLIPFGPERIKRVIELMSEHELAVFFIEEGLHTRRTMEYDKTYEDLIDHFLTNHYDSQPHMYLALKLLFRSDEESSETRERMHKISQNTHFPLIRSLARPFDTD